MSAWGDIRPEGPGNEPWARTSDRNVWRAYKGGLMLTVTRVADGSGWTATGESSNVAEQSPAAAADSYRGAAVGGQPRWRCAVTAPTEVAALVPNEDRGPRERYDIRPHGTEARARRERRHGRRPCPSCLAAENRAHAYRGARRAAGALVLPEPSEEARHA